MEGKAMRWGILTQNWIRLLEGIELKDTTKPRIGRVYLEQVGENMEYISQSSVFLNNKTEEVLS